MKIISVKQAGKHVWGKIDNSLKHEQKLPADLNSGSADFKHDSFTTESCRLYAIKSIDV